MGRAILIVFAVAALVGLLPAQDKEAYTDSEMCVSCHATEHSSWQSSRHNQTVTCLTCHDSHKGENPSQLRTEEVEELCSSCHTQRTVLQGKGAKGLEEMRSFHSAVDCVSCHMTEADHRMKVVRPDDPHLSEKRLDSCTSCHRDNNRKARAGQLRGWQASYKEGMDSLQAALKAVDMALKEKLEVLHDGLKTKLNALRFNAAMLEKDGSRGAHNLDFALEVMAAAAKDLNEIQASVK